VRKEEKYKYALMFIAEKHIYELRATSYELRATSYELRATSYELRATSYELRATSYELRATSYELRATRNRKGKLEKFQGFALFNFPL
jgi:hypothetical protein